MLIITLCNALSNPMIVSVHATGKIKRFQMLEGGVLLLIFPVAYLCLKLGMLPRTVFIVHLLIEIIAQFVRVWVVCPISSLSFIQCCVYNFVLSIVYINYGISEFICCGKENIEKKIYVVD